VDFPNLSAYARDLYQTPGFGETTDFDAIKRSYHLKDKALNPYSLIPKGLTYPSGARLMGEKRFMANQKVITVHNANEQKELIVYQSTEGRDWERVKEIMSYFGLSTTLSSDDHKLAFERSYAVTFLYDQEELIGFGRALSDGISQAAIYNIAVAEEYHGYGLGRFIIDDLLERVGHCNVVLFTHPKTLSFYKHLGFRKMKTGMAKYVNEEKLLEMGFIE
jgi:ribosomal protein S18 acetylase RimI-like enzyme